MAGGICVLRVVSKDGDRFRGARQDQAFHSLALDRSEKSLGDALGAQAKLVASDVTVVVLKNAGHWILEEQPDETIAALTRFLQ
jgi:pimeloyl-ACP methyl ester carboxylesterase